MIWESWTAFWDMGGRGAFVWGSYSALAIAVIAELVSLRRARTRALMEFNTHHDAEFDN